MPPKGNGHGPAAPEQDAKQTELLAQAQLEAQKLTEALAQAQ